MGHRASHDGPSTTPPSTAVGEGVLQSWHLRRGGARRDHSASTSHSPSHGHPHQWAGWGGEDSAKEEHAGFLLSSALPECPCPPPPHAARSQEPDSQLASAGAVAGASSASGTALRMSNCQLRPAPPKQA